MKWFERVIIVLTLVFFICGSELSAQLFYDGSYLLPDMSSSFQTVDVQTADIDLDGDLDIILANEFQNNIILVNDGMGNFAQSTQVKIPETIHDSEDIAIADFNLDGYPDLVFVSEDDFEHEYYFNNGSGGFYQAQYLPFTACNAVGTGDFNGDGAPDLFLGNRGQNYILINNGQGGMINETPDRLPQIADLTHDVKVVDVDNDQDEDIIIGNESGNLLFINDGTGKFTDQTALRLPQGLPLFETRKIIIEDVDMDNDLDIFVATVEFAQGRDAQNRLWRNNGAGFFTDVTQQKLPTLLDQSLDAIFMDVDQDDDPDLVIGGVISRPLKFYLNDGTGKFQDATFNIMGTLNVVADDFSAYALINGDFNNDGYEDIYVVNRDGKDYLPIRDPMGSIIGTVPVVELKGAETIRTYPNPSDGLIRLETELELFENDLRITLTDLRGKCYGDVFPLYVSKDRIGLDIRSLQLNPGVYFVNGYQESGSFHQKVMIR